MSKKFTVSELSRLLGVSVNTTWKKINKRGLITTKEVVNNREITVVVLNDDQFNELISESTGTQGVNNTVNNPYYEDTLPVNNHNEPVDNMYSQPTGALQGADMVAVIESVMNYSKEMNDQVKEYVERVINAEKQVKLLEDVESRKENQYLELTARTRELEGSIANIEDENNRLKLENEELREKLQRVESNLAKELKRPFWQRNVL